MRVSADQSHDTGGYRVPSSSSVTATGQSEARLASSRFMAGEEKGVSSVSGGARARRGEQSGDISRANHRLHAASATSTTAACPTLVTSIDPGENQTQRVEFTFLKAFLLAGGGNKTSRYKHKKTHLGHLFVPNNNDRLNVMSNTPCSHIVHSQ